MEPKRHLSWQSIASSIQVMGDISYNAALPCNSPFFNNKSVASSAIPQDNS